MAGSEIHPVFSARANFVQFENYPATTPLTKNKVRIDFSVDSIVKNGNKKNRIPLELASQIGAFLSVKVDESMFASIRHLLVAGSDLNIVVCPLAWKIENGSGMFFDLIEIEKFASMLEVA